VRYQAAREQLLEAVNKSTEVDLVRLSAGNISSRTEDGLVAITPSGVKYRGITAADMSIVDLNGNLIEGLKPSSETPMHTAIYRAMPEVGSVFHTHSLFAITFAMLSDTLPPDGVPNVNLELLVCGAPIPVAPWACPATVTAGEVTVELLKARPRLKVVLLRNHGLVAVGGDLNQAFDMAFNAEIGFQSYYQALTVGTPTLITDDQFAEVKAVYHL